MAVTRYSVGAIDPLMLGAFRFGIGFVFGLMVSWATFQGAVTELAVGWILVGTYVGRIGGMTVGEDGLYVVYEVRIAKCGVPRHTKEGSDMPYVHTTQTSSMPLPIPPRPHALKPRRICGMGGPRRTLMKP